MTNQNKSEQISSLIREFVILGEELLFVSIFAANVPGHLQHVNAYLNSCALVHEFTSTSCEHRLRWLITAFAQAHCPRKMNNQTLHWSFLSKPNTPPGTRLQSMFMERDQPVYEIPQARRPCSHGFGESLASSSFAAQLRIQDADETATLAWFFDWHRSQES